MKVLAGEIPQAADTALYQTACNTRCVSARNGEHRHIRLVALNELRKRIRAAHLMTAKALTDELRICVKRTQQLKAAGRKVKVIEQCTTEVADTQQNRRAAGPQTHDRTQLLLQFVDIIAVALLTKAAEAVKVLTNLRSGQSHALCQCFGGDTLLPFSLQLTNIPIIARQSLNYRFGNLLLAFHRTSPSLKFYSRVNYSLAMVSST